MRKYWNLKMAVIVFLSVLLVLVFFSKTAYTMNLPSVTAGMPKNGSLSKWETATGLASWAQTQEVYAQEGGEVEEILVSEGALVTKGQPLLRLSFDHEQIRREREELAVNQDKIQLEIQNINLQIGQMNRKLAEIKAEQEREVSKAKANYETQKELYDGGGISRKELDDAHNELLSVTARYETQLAGCRDDISTLKQSLQAKKLDMETLAIQKEAQNKTLGIDNTVIAPDDGTVSSILVKKGQRINKDEKLATIGTGEGFELTCSISLENNFVMAGDVCRMSNAGRSIEGTVISVTPGQNGKTVKISIKDQEVTAGETFTVRFEKESKEEFTLVPNSAVKQDSNGYFVCQVKKRKGILGDEFYTQKLRVYIGDADGENTAILKGIGFFEPIVVLSDQSFEENETVKLKNEGDFFAK